MLKTTFIIDGYGFVFRAYHSLPPLVDYNNIPVGALFGFTSMLMKVIKDFKPLHAAVVFDSGGKNFRHEIYSNYKMNRPEVPEELKIQFPLVRKAATALGFEILEQQGFEADDIIASLASAALKKHEKVVIVSSDKDLMQLICKDISMYDPIKNKFIYEQDVIDKFGVTPGQIRDFLAMTGDSSDNIPGIKGIGLKTASSLLTQYGNLENIISNIQNITPISKRNAIKEGLDSALLSQKLVTLDKNIDFTNIFDQLELKTPSTQDLHKFFDYHGFNSLKTKAEKLFNLPLNHLDNHPKDNHAKLISIKELEDTLGQAYETGKIVFYFNKQKEFLTLTFMVGSATFILENLSLHTQDSLLQNNEFIETLKILRKYLEDDSIHKITYDLKDIMKDFHNFGIEILPAACDDIMLMFYSINTGRKTTSLEDIADDITGIQEINDKSGQNISLIEKCYDTLKTQLVKLGAFAIYKQIDLPILHILSQMENHGVHIDTAGLHELSKEFEIELKELEAKMLKITGKSFNPASPKQVGEILYDIMQLPGGKVSVKSQSYSTRANILEELSEAGFEIADLLLRWRQLHKLKTTYTDSLPGEVSKKDNKIHTTFLQTSTNTGRLSSQHPNLQNIPIRTEEGIKIRSAFIAAKDHMLISADYSQIELRLISHIADIKPLKQAFIEGHDIHNDTACRIFNVTPIEVTPELRRKAKAINFGIIYGISPFGLAKQLNISKQEATRYIDDYFKHYPEILGYMESTKQFARRHLYVTTLIGRRCYVTSINDNNFQKRSFAERVAINAPLQGTTADIAKLAMIKVIDYFNKNNLSTKLILQVHDELVFEAPEEEVNLILPNIKRIMENVLTLSIPLIVDIKAGNSWAEIH